MFYLLPVSLIIFVLFLLFLPFLFLFWFLNLVSFSFQKLGLTGEVAFILLLLTLFGSGINIPLTKYKRRIKRKTFFGFFEFPIEEIEGVAINLGGAVVPLGVSLYLFTKIQDIFPILFALIFMIIISKTFSKVIPGRGIILPALIPPIFSALFALIFSPQNPAPCAYIAGTLGTLIGADILNLPKIRRYPGLISIGGAGVFDGIFLSGIVAVFLTAL
ncbi:MAG: DUF1614 domain-containing protein [Candidatus Pacebacteria bacterium]|nr:DUF1614 domain-containing protein [Candidatus Paceibacterota bacterium]